MLVRFLQLSLHETIRRPFARAEGRKDVFILTRVFTKGTRFVQKKSAKQGRQYEALSVYSLYRPLIHRCFQLNNKLEYPNI